MRTGALRVLVALAGVVAAIAVAGVIRFNFTDGGDAVPPTTSDLSDLVLTIDGQRFPMEGGVAELPAEPGSATRNTVRIVGDPVLAPPDEAGGPDAALVVVNDSGGSGRFFYAVVAVPEDGAYRATNALPLGDRIAPGRIDYRDGVFVYHYLGRRPGQAMSEPPTVENSLHVRLNRAAGVISADR